MGIVFQKSSLLVRDAKAKRKRATKLNKTAKQKLRSRRQQTFDYLIEETQTWMYAITLPTEIIANGDAAIKKNLDETIRATTAKLLGSKIDIDKVNRVCKSIARHLLIPGLANHGPDCQVAPLPSQDKLQSLLDDKHINAEILETVCSIYESFQHEHPDARTWREVREAFIGVGKLPDGLSVDWLIGQQIFYTFIELGAPDTKQPTADEKVKLNAKIRSPNASKLCGLGSELIDFHTIIVKATETKPVENASQPNATVVASMERSSNVMHLYDNFYRSLENGSSLRDVDIKVGETSLNDTCDGYSLIIFLHEITHSQSVLNSFDHKFCYIDSEIDTLDTERLIKYKNSAATDTRSGQEFVAYTLEACLALVRRDERDNINKAEDNADSWAIYFMIRMLMLAYPEIDILSALNTEDPFHIPDRIIQSRKELLHHCTLFERLRGRDPLPPMHQGGIRNQPGYDPSKDYWSASSGRRDARTVKDILEILQETLDKEEKMLEKKKKRNKKSKAKKKAKGMLKKKKKGVKVQTGSAADADRPSELRRMIASVFGYLEKLWKR